MNSTEERIRHHLQTSTSAIRGPGDAEAVMREGERRRTVSTLVAAIGTAAALAVVVAVVSLAPGDGSAPVATEPERPATTVLTDPPEPIPTTTAPEAQCGGTIEDDPSLPPAVEETRQLILALALTCDYESLADLARQSGTVLSVVGDISDPAAEWLEEAERSGEPVPAFVWMLTTTPHHDPETGIWSWPAVHGDPTDEQGWQELIPLLGTDTVTMLRADGSGYTGWRVGIHDDGTWRFAFGGD